MLKAKQKRRRRAQLFERQGGRCFYCERPVRLESTVDGRGRLAPDAATLDHYYPKARVPAEGRRLVLACNECNQAKGHHYWPAPHWDPEPAR